MGEALSVQEGQDVPEESVLLSHLIQLLHQRDGHSLLLSDLDALLPGVLRQRVKEQGLCSWLQRFPSLFAVVGQPGMETVTLCLGTDSAPEDVKGQTTIAVDTEAAQTEADPAAMDDEDLNAQSAVQLRGLPFRATSQDVVKFLGEHSSNLAEWRPQNSSISGVQLVQNRDGRPSGFARVQFTSPENAKRCASDLHLRTMDDRYIEVFVYTERPSKGRQRRGGDDAVQRSGRVGHEEAISDVVRPAAVENAAPSTREQVVQECRVQMSDKGNRRMLLSMLGVALSPGARSYLKQMDLGLKHFLVQFPNEFSVDGGKGCEYISYTPAQLSLIQAIDGFEEGGSPDELGHLTGTPKSIDARPTATPDHSNGPPSACRGIESTPSMWGTPSIEQLMGPPQPWVPPWPQGAPGMPTDANAWNAYPAFSCPGGNPFPWTGWSGFPPWSAPPANSEVNGITDAAAAPIGAVTGSSTSSASLAPQQAATGVRPEVPMHAVPPTPVPDGPTVAAVRLRGLPFTSAEQDILAFFAQHDIVDRIADGPKAVTIMTRSNGKPSGQAIVQMQETADADLARSVLHGQWMGNRYIEVFLLTAEEAEAATEKLSASAGTAVSSTKSSSTQDTISATQGVSAPAPMPDLASSLATPTLVPSASAFNGGTGPSQDHACPIPGIPPDIPPWQLSMWSAAMVSGMPGGSATFGADTIGASPEAASWEALFGFLNQENAAAAVMQPPPAFSPFGMPCAYNAPTAATV